MVALGFFIMALVNMFMGMFIVVTHGFVGIYLLSAKCRTLFYPPPETDEKQ